MIRIIPNALTLIRAALCPVVIILFLQGVHLAGLIVFIVLAATDYLDGYLARRWNAGSELGAFLDPLCDKATTLAFFSLFMTIGSCPQWFVALVLSSALLQGLAVYLLKARGHSGIFEPLSLSKWNTALQLLWIGIVFSDYLLQTRFPGNFRFSYPFHLTGYSFLAALQTVVFFQYVFRYRPFLFGEIRALLSKSA